MLMRGLPDASDARDGARAERGHGEQEEEA
jgi:hypothetical protein